MSTFKSRFLTSIFAIMNFPIFFTVALLSRMKKSRKTYGEYRVVWGTEAIINSYHWAKATAETFTSSLFISRYDSFILNGRASSILFTAQTIASPFSRVVRSLKENGIFVITFSRILSSANLVCISCDGMIFQHYKVSGYSHRVEYLFLKLAAIRICVLPYGSDAYVYSNLQDKNWLAGMLLDYPAAARHQSKIAKRVQFYVEKADIFLPGAMLFDGLGRSDWITPSTLCIDVPNIRRKRTNGPIFTITHAPNHRAIKGTQFIINAVNDLVDQGVNVQLMLIERTSNDTVTRILSEVSDLHIDQLFFDGYGLSALESMSFGVPTIGNFSGPSRDFFDRWTFTQNCPIVNADTNSLKEVILKLIEDKNLWEEISRRSYEYVRDYHSSEVFAQRFSDTLALVDPRFIDYLNSKMQ